MSEQFEMIAKTFQGLEEILAEELTALGANEVQIGRRMVSFSGDKEMMYKANFCLRTAIRILKPIKHFTAKDADEVYEQIKAIEWEKYMDPSKTFAIDAVVFSEEFRHSKFVSYKVKDAIVDYFREKTGERPSVRINKPDLMLNIHIAQFTCTLSLDSSGESLHRRGYRQEAVEAPLNEVLAAGMVMMTGWRGECDLIDPMSGSGTIAIEAALIARNIAPGVFRKEYAFEKWADFSQDLFDTIYNDDTQERVFEHKVYAYDNSPQANEIATRNVKAAGLSKDVILKVQPFQQFEQPTEKTVMITNPPYGERISTNDLLGLYQMIGERLKHAFVGNDAWILSYREECFEQIGLKPSQKIPLFNGALECQFRKYQLFGGRYKDYKSADGEEGERSFGDRKPFDGERKSFEGDRKPFSSERKSFDGERKPFEGERKPFNSERKSFDGERKPFDGDRKPFDGDRKPFEGDRKPFERRDRSDRRDNAPRGDFRSHREEGSSFGDRKPFDGDRKPFDGERKPFDGERKSFDRGSREERRDNAPRGEFRPRREEGSRSYGDRKPFDGDRKPFSTDRKPFENKGSDVQPSTGRTRMSYKEKEQNAVKKEERNENED